MNWHDPLVSTLMSSQESGFREFSHMCNLPWCRPCHLNKCWSNKYLHLKKRAHFFFSFRKNCGLLRGSGCTSYDLPEEGDLPRWFHILWRLHRIQVTRLQTEALKFPQTPHVCAEKSLFSIHCTWAFKIGDINIKKRLFSLAFKGQVWGVKCHNKVILPTHKNTQKIKVWLYLYSHKLTCTQKCLLILTISFLVPMATTQVNNVVLRCQVSFALVPTEASQHLPKPHPSPTGCTKTIGRRASLLHIHSPQKLSGCFTASHHPRVNTPRQITRLLFKFLMMMMKKWHNERRCIEDCIYGTDQRSHQNILFCLKPLETLCHSNPFFFYQLKISEGHSVKEEGVDGWTT